MRHRPVSTRIEQEFMPKRKFARSHAVFTFRKSCAERNWNSTRGKGLNFLFSSLVRPCSVQISKLNGVLKARALWSPAHKECWPSPPSSFASKLHGREPLVVLRWWTVTLTRMGCFSSPNWAHCFRYEDGNVNLMHVLPHSWCLLWVGSYRQDVDGVLCSFGVI